MTPETILDVLASAPLEIEGRIVGGANHTFLGVLDLAGDEMRVIYKPADGELLLDDFPPDLYKRELTAYSMSRMLGWPRVPETVIRDDLPFGRGSLQRFIDADFSEHYFTLRQDARYTHDFTEIAVFDLVTNNADRKSGHCLIDDEKNIYAIDHGLCFHFEPKLRTVMWDFAGQNVPATLIDQLVDVRGRLIELETFLTAREVVALVGRLDELIENPVFPSPSSHRDYPWPLV